MQIPYCIMHSTARLDRKQNFDYTTLHTRTFGLENALFREPAWKNDGPTSLISQTWLLGLPMRFDCPSCQSIEVCVMQTTFSPEKDVRFGDTLRDSDPNSEVAKLTRERNRLRDLLTKVNFPLNRAESVKPSSWDLVPLPHYASNRLCIQSLWSELAESCVSIRLSSQFVNRSSWQGQHSASAIIALKTRSCFKPIVLLYVLISISWQSINDIHLSALGSSWLGCDSDELRYLYGNQCLMRSDTNASKVINTA